MPGRYFPGAGPWGGEHVRFLGYEADKDGIALCAVGPQMRKAMRAIVGQAVEFAQLIAPNDDGQYQRSFSTEVLIVPDIPYRVRGLPMPRWAGRIVNDAPHAILVEVGAGRAGQFEHRVLRRTLEWIELVADD